MVRGFREFGEANGGVNVIAQHGLAGFDVSQDEAFDAFAQKLLAERGVALCAGLDGLFEVAG
jgi:hypothetical protein